MKSSSDQLRSAITSSYSITGSPLDHIVAFPDIHRFAKYLALTSHIIRASTDLMHCAIQQSKTISDDRNSALESYLNHHIDEENDHYEWIREDLLLLEKFIGNKIDYFSLVDSPEVQAVAGSVYYQIRNISHWSVFGYMALLETFPPSIETLSSLERILGAPKSAFRTLAAHSELDVNHSDEIYEFIDAVGLSEIEIAAARKSAIYSIQLYSQCISSIIVNDE